MKNVVIIFSNLKYDIIGNNVLRRLQFMADLKQLKADAKGFSILYVEDNEKLRANAYTLLKKIFDHVLVSSDGAKGLAVFKQHKPSIVITDIKMPNMDGFEMVSHIYKIAPQTKIIVMSAFDEKDNLFKAIELRVFRFLKKPVNVMELAEVLSLAVKQFQDSENTEIFVNNLKNIFNYQSSMVVMFKESKPIMVNQVFLDFFDVESLEEFEKRYRDIGKLFLEHDGFLYDSKEQNWFNELQENTLKLYNVKIKDKLGSDHHLILKYQKVPDKESCAILSFDDITEFNLLNMFSNNQNVKTLPNIEEIITLLEVLKRNGAKLTMYNLYKGLTIANDVFLMSLKKNSVIVKTSYMQQKAVQYEKQSLLIADALPHAISLSSVENIDFDKYTIEFRNINFTLTSPMIRKTVRVVPEDGHTVSLLIDNAKFQGEVVIEDISIDAIKLRLKYLPAGIKEDGNYIIDCVLSMDKKPFILNATGNLYRKTELEKSFNLVFLTEYTMSQRSELIKYITKRQMAIIREFKGLKNG